MDEIKISEEEYVTAHGAITEAIEVLRKAKPHPSETARRIQIMITRLENDLYIFEGSMRGFVEGR